MNIKNFIPVVPNWPVPGVNFLDITKLLENAEAFNYCLYVLQEHAGRFDATSIVAVESRGFVIGSVLAARLNLPLVLARKPGRLPRAVYSQSYQTEYSTDNIEINQDAAVGTRPYIVDDLLATGGTVLAVNSLLNHHFNVESVGAGVVVSLAFLPGATNLANNQVHLDTVTVYE
jgi:adenine phosphoribosyltransferase